MLKFKIIASRLELQLWAAAWLIDGCPIRHIYLHINQSTISTTELELIEEWTSSVFYDSKLFIQLNIRLRLRAAQLHYRPKRLESMARQNNRECNWVWQWLNFSIELKTMALQRFDLFDWGSNCTSINRQGANNDRECEWMRTESELDAFRLWIIASNTLSLFSVLLLSTYSGTM